MKKWIFSVSLFLSFSLGSVENQFMKEHSHTEVPIFFTEGEAEYVHPDSVQSSYLKVKGMDITGFEGESKAKLERAFQVLEKVVNSEEFKAKVLNFKNKQGERSFASNKGMSNEDIYEHLMEGREDLQPNTAGEMNFYLKLYNRPWSRVIGYTTPEVNLIHVNWKFFKNFKAHQVAANLAHEWLHKMGFGHRSAAEHDSVPYAVGYIVEEMAKTEFLKTELP